MKEVSGYVFSNECSFLKIADLVYDSDEIIEELVPAIVANYAFSVELMLKSLDVNYQNVGGPSAGLLPSTEIETNIRGHKLANIFSQLPHDSKELLKKAFKECTKEEIEPILDLCNNDFALIRYAHESQSKKIYRIGKLRLLAQGVNQSIREYFA
ncbi:hypothetical protein [Catenovulum maritimum]|uniref:Uncharacterized protein n=1 Tax=Catenovulum maritimum TaxID=1513271 RepID=A0A0J8JPX7_9ALTE|nr:hypothetical protein [Catenovulum maritimum]KMT66746.1 hypothetical protein XM47_01065 [Catenovulum maritimum]